MVRAGIGDGEIANGEGVNGSLLEERKGRRRGKEEIGEVGVEKQRWQTVRRRRAEGGDIWGEGRGERIKNEETFPRALSDRGFRQGDGRSEGWSHCGVNPYQRSDVLPLRPLTESTVRD